MKGRIHSFDSFGTLDGPGIRFLVFMQGCPLRCKYCHNRDTWSCDYGNWYTADEVLEKALKYKNYMNYSNGGITVTGGEALMQIDFLIELFSKAKEHGIHTCLDTSGYVAIEKIKPLLPYTDLILLDIKHMDDETHQWLTGVSNKTVLRLAKYLSDVNQPVWIRHVLIPGITDDITHLNEFGKFLATLKNVEKLELLPYSNIGKFKWEQLGEYYELNDVPNCTELDITLANSLIRRIKNRHL